MPLTPSSRDAPLNFHLILGRDPNPAAATSARYRARVISSPVGEASVTFAAPFAPNETEALSWRANFSPRGLSASPITTRNIRLTSAPDSAADHNPPPLTLTQIGTRLFDAAFGGEVGTLFARSLDAAANSGTNGDHPLRLQLQFDEVPELAELPWEYLYSRALDRFIVLSTRTPLVRYLPLAQPAPALAVTPPLRLLVVVASPADLPHLNVEAEWQHLNQALAALVQAGSIVVERLQGATITALRQRLLQPGVNILHFIGHGDFAPAENISGQSSASGQGLLFFEDSAGQQEPVSATQLATLLHDHTALRLVFLNACHGATSGGAANGRGTLFAGVAQKLVQQGVPSVLAMQFAISDAAAIALARDFYSAIAAGLPVECAVSEARKGIFSEGGMHEGQESNFEWGTPLLFSRSPDGFLFVPEGNGEESSAMSQSSESESSTTGASATAPPPWWQGIGSIQASGDVIIATIGDNAHNVAVGKQITQQIYELVGPPTPSDKEVITQKLQEVRALLEQQAAQNTQAAIGAANLKTAKGYMQLLGGELTKTADGETPSASTITLVGNWLLDNVPEILEALTSLFATPAVGRVIGKAGEVAVAWVKERFGEHNK